MNENEVKIGVIGKIIEGDLLGWFLFIKEDFEESGGYLILISKDSSMSKYAEGYDYWAEDESTLIEMLKAFKWKIQWLDKNPFIK
jgi:hypothetical protein